ncbi:DedA family protein [Bifidobacterium fermentum]|uniref:DedA family protein n=1 Tax=Bifidobacterium fermentum TaxID=3059035 RepID=A0AB39UCM5_9BIFI
MPSFLSPEFIIATAGPWALAISALIVFAESGLLIGFFLPGDSLVFLLGMVSAATAMPDSSLAHTPIWLICIIVAVCAFIGDQLGYELGKKGRHTQLVQSWATGKNGKRLDRANRFFDNYGAKAIILARFIPILRTFVPFAVGLTLYSYRRFLPANAIGAILWGATVPITGYSLGRIPVIANHVDILCILIILVSILPIIIKGVIAWFSKREVSETTESE